MVQIQIARGKGKKVQETQKGARVLSTGTFFSEISRRCGKIHVIDL
jgi:hypothetical protein